MQATVMQYLDTESGVRHIHVQSEDKELGFLVAFPTVPDRSDGRAHILEHIVLSGSMRYPVRDPFFSMMRRSVATFMNAMTYPDRTVYLFSSTERKDFLNLLDVYLDAVFFPKLDYLSFRQEGWRYELHEGALSYQGVVFNEMKGVFSSPVRSLMSQINAVMLKGTTYEMESGGDPLRIPELTHEMLLDFHATHYHPSQAIVMSFGDINPEVIQTQISEQVLTQLSGYSERRVPQLAPTWDEPKKIVVQIPAQFSDPDGFGLQYAWLLGESTDMSSNYDAYLLYVGLLGDSSAPMMALMESAGFGRPSQLNGADDSARQIIFHIGMEGLTKEQIAQAQALIWDGLADIARNGVPHAVLQAALRDFKYYKKNRESSQTPYVLSKLLSAVPFELHGANALDAFDDEKILNDLEMKIEDPHYFKGLVQSLLNSPTRLVTTVEPDVDYFKKRDAIEKAQLADMSDSMPDSMRVQILKDMEALDADQKNMAGIESLPRIAPTDVSPNPAPLPRLTSIDHVRQTATICSNGIIYSNVIYDVSHLPEEQWNWLNLYIDVVDKLGTGSKSFQETGAWRQSKVTNFGVHLSAIETQQSTLNLEVFFTANGLSQDRESLLEVINDLINDVRFDELDRIGFLVRTSIKEKISSLADMGDRYARMTALAPLAKTAYFEHVVDGLGSFHFYQKLFGQCANEEGLQSIADSLHQIHQLLINIVPQIFIAGEAIDIDAIKESYVVKGTFDDENIPTKLAEKISVGHLSNDALYAVAQVNHCIAAWSVPKLGHADAGALAVVAELISNQILHRLIREKGGAYGGRASYLPSEGVFMLSSYRDPRLADTYADFMAAIDWIFQEEITLESIEEAIICVIKSLDKPLSPYAAVRYARNIEKQGITEKQRQQFRTQVLECNVERLIQVTHAWLKPQVISRAAFVGSLDQDLASLKLVPLQISIE